MATATTVMTARRRSGSKLRLVAAVSTAITAMVNADNPSNSV
jgi:hypothetical protein